MKPEAHDPILGCLFGGAVGDALGLPTEGVSRSRVNRLCAGSIRHRLIFGRGMLSDDTEHTAMVAKALLRHADDVASFQRSLSWSLRWWFLALPGGVGMATARAILRLRMSQHAQRPRQRPLPPAEPLPLLSYLRVLFHRKHEQTQLV